MKVKNFYSSVPVNGQVFEMPSITEPDLAMSIEQLVSQYSVGHLPSISVLQDYLDAELPVDKLDDDDLQDDSLSAENDYKFADKVDMLERFFEANQVRKSIFKKVKEQHEFRKKKESELLGKYKDKYGDLTE